MFFVLKMLLQFIVRALFIRFLGKELLGLNGLFTNVLNMLALAELGIGNAIVYSMYAPIAEGNTEKTKSLLRVYRNVYIGIGIAVAVIGLALIPALPYLIKDIPDTPFNINILYILYLVNSVSGYFFAYRRALVFAAQRNDIENKAGILAQFITAILQIVVMVTVKNYYYYAAALIVGSVVDSLTIFAVSYKIFPEIRGRAQKLPKEDSRFIIKNSSAKFVQAIGWNAVFSTDSLIISSFLGLGILGVYSNYTLIMTSLISVVNIFCTAVKGSVGNMMATADREKVYGVFRALSLALFWLIGFIFIGLVCCYQDFILLFTGSKEYVLAFGTMLFLSLQFYFRVSRYIVETFKDCAGLFWNDWFRPLLETAANLGLDFLLLYFMGINGIVLATIISTIGVSVWIEAYVLFKNYFKKNVCRYFFRYIVYTILIFIVAAITFAICYFIPTGGFLRFLIKFGICLIVPNVLFLLLSFKTPEFRYLSSSLKRIFSRSSTVDTTCENSPMDNETLKRLQNAELSVMTDIDAFCKKHEIHYSLFAGTALGAVRHKGFIPWDDDIDICMERGEYERFLELWSENSFDGYYLQGTRECDATSINHTKIRRLNTVCASKKEYESDPEHQGIWVDIFPFDKVPLKKSLRKKVLLKAKIMLLYTRGYPIKNSGKFKEIVSRILLLIPKFMRKRIKHRCESYIKKSNDLKSDFTYRSFVSVADFNIDYPQNLFEKLQEIEFEDRSFLLTERYDDMLTAEYGNYMELPPPEKRIPIHRPEILIFEEK